jgi:hypothetical protein
MEIARWPRGRRSRGITKVSAKSGNRVADPSKGTTTLISTMKGAYMPAYRPGLGITIRIDTIGVVVLLVLGAILYKLFV